jgi:hypothetical protein
MKTPGYRNLTLLERRKLAHLDNSIDVLLVAADARRRDHGMTPAERLIWSQIVGAFGCEATR